MQPSPTRALAAGLGDVIRAPFLLAGVAVVVVLIALPFAAVLQSRLQSSLSVQPQISLDDTEIDADWWAEFRRHAHGLEATFTPAVLGFAATLDGISNILDGRAIPAALLAPLLVSMAAWSFIWGGVLQRFHPQSAIGARGFARAGRAYFLPFAAIAVIAAAVNVLLLLTVHRVLFGPIHTALAGLTTTERDAFLVRAVLYLIFVSLLAAVSLIADYARIAAVSRQIRGPIELLRTSAIFVRRHAAPVVVLFVLTGAIFVALTAGYGVLEVVGGSEVGGWRAVAIGQGYVLLRLAIRLTFAASELRLFNANQTAAAE